MLRVMGVGAVVLIGLVAGCSGGSSSDAGASSGAVPTETRTVYLATALACSKLKDYSTRFDPLKVEGEGYRTTVKPKQGCVENAGFNSYVYEVPASGSGPIKVTPGNQPSATLEATDFEAGAVTVFYAVDSGDSFKVSVIRPGKDDAVSSATP